jgi:hypothetical protein
MFVLSPKPDHHSLAPLCPSKPQGRSLRQERQIARRREAAGVHLQPALWEHQGGPVFLCVPSGVGCQLGESEGVSRVCEGAWLPLEEP